MTDGLRNGNRANAALRHPDEPAGTLFFAKRSNWVAWVGSPDFLAAVQACREAPRALSLRSASPMTGEVDAVDLFAGPGGWDVAARELGLNVLGIELDDAACATREAAGHATVKGDVAALDPSAYPARGLIGSPPCPTFSAAGNGAGRLLVAILIECAKALVDGRDTRGHAKAEAFGILHPIVWEAEQAKARKAKREPDGEKAWMRAQRDAAMSVLVVEPLRWAMANRSEWIALEQVPPVLAIWRAFAAMLETQGYRCWTGILEAERYGVPQTRERAILLARLDGQPHPPTPTHQRYVPGECQRHDVTLDGEILPWVSMAEALGWARESAWSIDQAHREARQAIRTLAEPAPTLKGASAGAQRVWTSDGDAPAMPFGGEPWQYDRPSTNVNGDPRISAPGRHDPGQSGSQQEGAIRVTVQEAAILQGFPADYPWQGSRTAQFQQVGNAVPPPLARAILAALLGVDSDPIPPGGGAEANGATHYDRRQDFANGGVPLRPIGEPAPTIGAQGLAKGRDRWVRDDHA